MQRCLLPLVFVLSCLCVSQAMASTPPSLLLTLKLDGPKFTHRYAAFVSQYGSMEAFEEEVCRRTVEELNKRALWSALCWPLHWTEQPGQAGTLQIILVMQPNDWLFNLQLIRPDKPPEIICDCGLWQTGRILPNESGPKGNDLHLAIVDRLRVQLLELDSFERFRTKLRQTIPVGTAVYRPAPEIPDAFGFVKTDHPILRDKGVAFEFVYLPDQFTEDRLKVRGTGRQYPAITDGGSSRWIIVEFFTRKPPDGTEGEVYLDSQNSFDSLPML